MWQLNRYLLTAYSALTEDFKSFLLADKVKYPVLSDLIGFIIFFTILV